MVRATDTERLSFNDSQAAGMRDFAVLAGARSRGDRLFVTGSTCLRTPPIAWEDSP